MISSVFYYWCDACFFGKPKKIEEVQF